MDLENMGARIQALRISNGLSMAQLAGKVGVDKSTISRWESGRIEYMGQDKVTALSLALGASVEYLLGLDGGVYPSHAGANTQAVVIPSAHTPAKAPTLASAVEELQRLVKNAEVVTSEERELLNTFRALTPKQRAKFFRYLDMVVDE